jgi:hypothetical protein
MRTLCTQNQKAEKQPMIINKTLSACTLLILLSACETKEEFQARRNQFNGQTVAAVSQRIGRPVAQDKTKAVWITRNTYVDRDPIVRCRQGRCYTVGYHTQVIEEKCTFTATLKAGRIMTSTYKGDSCGPLSPRLKKS